MKASRPLALLPLLFVVLVGCGNPGQKNEVAPAKISSQKSEKTPRASVPVEPAAAPEVPMPKIVSRTEWKAKAPISEMKRQEFKFITIHHTATKQNPKKTAAEKMRGLQDFSQREDKLASGKVKPAWPDVPYHFVVMPSGEIAEGRQIEFVGDTNTEYDPTGHILVTLDGNFENESISDAQWTSTVALVKWLSWKYHVPTDKIAAHRDYAQTLCPGKNLYNRLQQIRDATKQ